MADIVRTGVRGGERVALPYGGWDRLFGDFFEGSAAPARAWNPAFDVKETKTAFVLTADVPGLADKDLDIQVHGNTLTVGGRRNVEDRHEGEAWVSVERARGTFTRAWNLPDSIDGDKISAQLEHGVLTLVLPKRPEVTPRKISVRGAAPGPEKT